MKKLLLGLSLVLGLLVFCPHSLKAVVTNTATQTQSALGNGSNKNFTISFDFRSNSQLSVYLAETSSGSTVLTQIFFGSASNQYTLSGGDPATTVVMGTAPSTTQYVLIKRSIPFTQPVQYDEAAAFPAADHMTQMDQMVMMIQGLNSTINSVVAAALPALPNNQIYIGQSNNQAAAVALTGDLSINSAGVTAIGTSAVTSDKIADGTIVNADINTSAAIASTKISFRVPTIQKLLTGSGTYTAPTNPAPLYLEVELVGGGGGGGGSGSSGGGTGGTGGSTFLGPLVGNGGTGGVWKTTGGSGGTATLGSGPSGISLSGGSGGGALVNNTGDVDVVGGMGAASVFGGAGGGKVSAAGQAAAANSGSGGGGAGITWAGSDYDSAGGGGAGGYVNAYIVSPALTYLYAVGSAGTAGTAGSNGFAGGAGGSGIILIKEHYQ